MRIEHRAARFRMALAMTLSLVLWSACREQPAATRDAVVVRDSAGVAMVTSNRAQWPDGGGWRIDTVPRTSLGGVEADSNQHWRFVEAAALLRDGRVVIGIDGELRWFAANGTHLRSTPAGDGPGEFRHIAALHVLPGDSLRAHDSYGLKYAVFAPDGSLAYERRTDTDRLRALGRWIECAGAHLPDASRLLCQIDASIPASATNRASRRLANGLTSPGPGLLRTLHRIWLVTPTLDRAYPLGIGAGIEQFGVETGSGERFVMHPFYSRSIVAAGGEPLRIASALNPAYRIELWTPSGVLERVILRDGGRRAPTAEELADVPEALRSAIGGNDQMLIDRVAAAVPTPDSLPALGHIALTPRGELLVLREGLLPSHTQAMYDVFDREGVWLGTLRTHVPLFIVSAGDEALLTFRRSDTGVQLVEVYGYTRLR